MTPSLKRKRSGTRGGRAATWQRVAAKLVLKKGLSLASKAVNKRMKASHTKTKRKGGDEHPGVKESDGGASVSRYTKLNKGPKKAKTRTFDTHILKEVKQRSSIGDSGSLSAFFETYWDYTDINLMVGKLYEQLPDETLPVNSSTAQVNALRPYLLSARAKFNFANMANSQQWLTIYDIHCKDSTDNGPVEEWYTGAVEEQGEGLNVAGVTRQSNQFDLGSTPQMSKRFKRTWKIDKVTKVFLRPGEQHAHFINHGPHKAWENSYLQSRNNEVGGTHATRPYIGGVTRAVMWTQSGNICMDGTTQRVSTTGTKAALVYEIAYRYSMLRFPQGSIQTSSDIAPISGDPNFINEDTSTVISNAFAG